MGLEQAHRVGEKTSFSLMLKILLAPRAPASNQPFWHFSCFVVCCPFLPRLPSPGFPRLLTLDPPPTRWRSYRCPWRDSRGRTRLRWSEERMRWRCVGRFFFCRQLRWPRGWGESRHEQCDAFSRLPSLRPPFNLSFARLWVDDVGLNLRLGLRSCLLFLRDKEDQKQK